MVEKQINKIVTMATMTELVDEPILIGQNQGNGEEGSDENYLTAEQHNYGIIRSALKLRYERDPTFHDRLNKLALTIQK